MLGADDVLKTVLVVILVLFNPQKCTSYTCISIALFETTYKSNFNFYTLPKELDVVLQKL